MIGTYIQMTAALLFVLLLIFAAGYILRKKHNKFGLMNIVSYQPFGTKKGVAALKIGEEILILGITPNDMRLLKIYKDSELDLTATEGFHRKLEKFRRIGA